MQMKPVSFLYKDAQGDANLKKRKVGMIAEDVDLIDPRLVSYEQDGTTPRSIMYAEYTAVLTKAIQDQQVEIQNLNAFSKDPDPCDKLDWLGRELLCK